MITSHKVTMDKNNGKVNPSDLSPLGKRRITLIACDVVLFHTTRGILVIILQCCSFGHALNFVLQFVLLLYQIQSEHFSQFVMFSCQTKVKYSYNLYCCSIRHKVNNSYILWCCPDRFKVKYSYNFYKCCTRLKPEPVLILTDFITQDFLHM